MINTCDVKMLKSSRQCGFGLPKSKQKQKDHVKVTHITHEKDKALLLHKHVHT